MRLPEGPLDTHRSIINFEYSDLHFLKMSSLTPFLRNLIWHTDPNPEGNILHRYQIFRIGCVCFVG